MGDSDLSDFCALFGPSERQEDPVFQHRQTAWPYVEERIRLTLDVWEGIAGFHPTDEQTKRQWRYGARQWVDAHGENATELLRRTAKYMQRHDLMMTSPGSCINIARRFKPENRKMYLCPMCFQYPHADDCDSDFEPPDDREGNQRPKWAKRRDLD